MLQHLRPAFSFVVLFTLLTGLAYPLAMTGISGALMPNEASGSIIYNNGAAIGSDLIGQNFTGDRYFHGRLSATTGTDPNDATKSVALPYNADNSSGSNLGPTSKALVDRITASIKDLKAAGTTGPIPADAVTTSGSGLDPHISPAFAALQVARVARARGLDEARIATLVKAMTEGRLFGLLGEPRVNVLRLNLVLDAMKGT